MLDNRPFIAISANGVDAQNAGGFRRLECSSAYTHAIAHCGGMPALLCETGVEDAVRLFDGLLLTGGGDIDPVLFGEEVLNDTVNIDPQRDAFELPLARAFIAAGKPVLGICRGAQVVNVAMGGTLYQDLPAQLGFVHFDTKLRHFVTSAEGSMMRELFGETFRVNSTHHQAVRELAPGLRASAVSPEGIIEAFEHETLPVIGTQFHPERLSLLKDDARTPDFLPLFERFVSLCRKHAANR